MQVCQMCGQCCKRIHFNQYAYDAIMGDSPADGDVAFCRENLEYIGLSDEVEGGFIRDWVLHVFRCKLITEDNKCSVHENKPYVCRGYPFYAGDGIPWPYPGCPHERKSYELQMIAMLKQRKKQLEIKERT